jgi:hypothetical protein
MVDAEIESHLAELRRLYVEATPRQRLSVAKQRILNPEHDPNRLIAYVSAVEGFARALCMHLRAKGKSELSAIYAEYRWRGPEDLVREYLAAKGLSAPESHFENESWDLFRYAVQYRNLLAHECTYLGLDKSPALVNACRTVLRKLATHEGLNADDI